MKFNCTWLVVAACVGLSLILSSIHTTISSTSFSNRISRESYMRINQQKQKTYISTRSKGAHVTCDMWPSSLYPTLGTYEWTHAMPYQHTNTPSHTISYHQVDFVVKNPKTQRGIQRMRLHRNALRFYRIRLPHWKVLESTARLDPRCKCNIFLVHNMRHIGHV